MQHFHISNREYPPTWKNGLILYLFLCVGLLKLQCFLCWIYQKLLSIFLANMGKSLSVHKLVWKVTLKCQINEIINTRIKQPVFQKIKGKHNHILRKGTRKDFRKAFRIKVSISHPMSYPYPPSYQSFKIFRKGTQ